MAGENNKDAQMIQFHKGMNQDTDKALVPEGNYHFALNGRLYSIDGDSGAFHNINGSKSCFKPYDFQYYHNDTDPSIPLTVPFIFFPPFPPDEIQPDIKSPVVYGDRVYILGSCDIDDLMFVIGVVYRINPVTKIEEPYRDFIGVHAPNGVERKGYKIIKWSNIDPHKPAFDTITVLYPPSSVRQSVYLKDSDFTESNCYYQLIYVSDNRHIDPSTSYKPLTLLNLFRDYRIFDCRPEVQFDKSITLYFTDNFNQPRRYNTNEIYASPNNPSLNLNLKFPVISIPDEVENFILVNQGFLDVGSYRVAIRYADSNFNYTNISYLSHLIDIVPSVDRTRWWDYDGGDSAESPTTKAFQIEVFNVDTSFKYLQLVVLKYVDGTSPIAYVDNLIDISTHDPNNKLQVIHKGDIKEFIDISAVQIDNLIIERCKTLDIVENRLFIGNIVESEIDNEAFQRVADKIKLQFHREDPCLGKTLQTQPAGSGLGYSKKKLRCVNSQDAKAPHDFFTTDLDGYGHYQNEWMCYEKMSFMSDQWYSFGIQFVLNSGKKTPVFWIGKWFLDNPVSSYPPNFIDEAIYNSAIGGIKVGSKRAKSIFKQTENGQDVYLFKTPCETTSVINNITDIPSDDVRQDIIVEATLNILNVEFDFADLVTSEWNDIKDKIQGFTFYRSEREYEYSIGQGITLQSLNDCNGAGCANPTTNYVDFARGEFYSSLQGNGQNGFWYKDIEAASVNYATFFSPDINENYKTYPINGSNFLHILYDSANFHNAIAINGLITNPPLPLVSCDFISRDYQSFSENFFAPYDSQNPFSVSSYMNTTSSVTYQGIYVGWYVPLSSVNTTKTQFFLEGRTSNFYLIASVFIGAKSSLERLNYRIGNHVYMNRDIVWNNPGFPGGFDTTYHYKIASFNTRKSVTPIQNREWRFLKYIPLVLMGASNLNTPIQNNKFKIWYGDCFPQYTSFRYITFVRYEQTSPPTPNPILEDDVLSGVETWLFTENQYNWQFRYWKPTQTNTFYPQNDQDVKFMVWKGGMRDMPEAINYNFAYSAPNNSQVATSLPLGFVSLNQFPTRIRYSQLKVVGQKSDPYRLFYPLDFRDDDLRYGEITEILNYFSNILSIQRQAVNMRNVNMQATQNIQGQSILLGTGSVLLQKPTYINTEYGSQHQGSVVKTADSVYGIDCRQSEIWCIKGQEFKMLASEKQMYTFVQNWLDKHTEVALHDNSYQEIKGELGTRRLGLHAYYDSLYDDVYFTFYYQIQLSDGIGNVYPVPEISSSDSRCLKFSVRTDSFDSFVFGHPYYPTDVSNIPGIFDNESSSYIMPDILMRLGNLFFGYQVLTQSYPLSNPSQDIFRNRVYEMNIGDRGKFFGWHIDFALRVIANKDFIMSKVFDNIIWNGNIKRIDGKDVQFIEQFFQDADFIANYSKLFNMKVQNDYQASYVDLVLDELIKRVERSFNVIIPADMLYETLSPSANELPEEFLIGTQPLPTQKEPEDINPHLVDISLINPDAPFIEPDTKITGKKNIYSNGIFRERFRDKWAMFTFRFKNNRVLYNVTLKKNIPVSLNWKYLFRTLYILYRRSFR